LVVLSFHLPSVKRRKKGEKKKKKGGGNGGGRGRGDIPAP